MKTKLAILIALAFVSCKKDPILTKQTEPVWAKQGSVITATASQEEGNVQEPNVLYDTCPQLLKGNKWVFKMWYRSGWSNPYISYAESVDGIMFTKYDSVLVKGYYCPSMFKKDGVYYIHASKAGAHQIDCYTSTDGIHFAFNSVSLAIEGMSYGNTSIIYDSLKGWYMLYDRTVGSTNSDNGSLATSQDGIHWNDYPNNPVIQTSSCSCPGKVYKIGDVYYGYIPVSITGLLPTDIYRYKSTDMINWIQSPTTPVMYRTTADEGIGSNVGQVCDPSIVEVNGKTYMYYDAGPNGLNGTISYEGTGDFRIKLAIANMTMVKLITTNEGVK